MDARIGGGDVAIELGLIDLFRQEREGDGFLVARLGLQLREVDRPAIEPGWRPRLEPTEFEAQRPQARREPLGRGVPRASSRRLDLPGVHERLQEGPGRHHHGPGVIGDISAASQPRQAPPFDDDRLDHLLAQGQILLPFDGQLREGLVGLLVALARGLCMAGPLPRLRRRNWREVASAIVPIAPPSASTSRTICPLATPPIAGLQLICPTASQLIVKQGGAPPHPRRGQRGLQAGVAGADDDHLEVVRVVLASRHDHRTRSGIDVRTSRDVPVIIADSPRARKPARPIRRAVSSSNLPSPGGRGCPKGG